MTKFDTSIYILQIAVTMDSFDSFEVTLTCFHDAKNIKGYNKPTLFYQWPQNTLQVFIVPLCFESKKIKEIFNEGVLLQ